MTDREKACRAAGLDPKADLGDPTQRWLAIQNVWPEIADNLIANLAALYDRESWKSK